MVPSTCAPGSHVFQCLWLLMSFIGEVFFFIPRVLQTLCLNGTSPDGVLSKALHNVLEPRQAQYSENEMGKRERERKKKIRHPHNSTIHTQTSARRRQAPAHAGCRVVQHSAQRSILELQTHKVVSHVSTWLKAFYTRIISHCYIRVI